jgi:O-antigen ligase
VRRARDARLGMAVALGFALILGAARVIDVSEDGKAMLAFSMLFFPALACAAVARPLWFLLLAVAYLPFSKVYALSLAGISGANMSNVILLLAPVAWLSSRAQRRARFRVGWLEALVASYALVGSISVIPAASQLDGIGALAQTYRTWLAPMLFFFIARGLARDRESIHAVLRVMAWVTILVAALTWVEGIGRGNRGSIDASRVPGLMGQANQMGAFLVYYGVLLLAIGLREPRLLRRLPFLGGFLVAARAMLFTFSRSAYLALAAGSTLVVLLHSPLLLVAGMGGGAAAVTVRPSLIPESIRARFGQTTERVGLQGETGTLDKSSAYRLILWRAAWRMVRERPLTGVGLGCFSLVVGHYTEVQLSKEDPNDAHNAFILIAAENGIPALLLAVLLLATFATVAARVYLRSRYRTDRTLALGYLGMWVGLIASCMLGSRFADESLIGYFWILSALLAVTNRFSLRPVPRRRP